MRDLARSGDGLVSGPLDLLAFVRGVSPPSDPKFTHTISSDPLMTEWAAEWARGARAALHRLRHARAIAMRAAWAAKQSPKAS
jgi:hypothetical protein